MSETKRVLFVCSGNYYRSRLAEVLFNQAAEKNGLRLFVPPLSLCGDNAAMIGCQGYYEYLAGARAGCDLNAYANMEI